MSRFNSDTSENDKILLNEFIGLLRTSVSVSIEDKIKILGRLEKLTSDQIKSLIEVLKREDTIKKEHYDEYVSLQELKAIEWPLILKIAKSIRDENVK